MNQAAGGKSRRARGDNMKQVLYINAEREGYAIDQIRNTMTVGELICYLEQFDEDTPVYLKHDRGYTFGAIKESRFEDEEVEGDDDEETDDESENEDYDDARHPGISREEFDRLPK